MSDTKPPPHHHRKRQSQQPQSKLNTDASSSSSSAQNNSTPSMSSSNTANKRRPQPQQVTNPPAAASSDPSAGNTLDKPTGGKQQQSLNNGPSRRKQSGSTHRKSQSVNAPKDKNIANTNVSGSTAALTNLQQMIDSMKSIPAKQVDDNASAQTAPRHQRSSSQGGSRHRKTQSHNMPSGNSASAVPSLNPIADQDESLAHSFKDLAVDNDNSNKGKTVEATGVPPVTYRYSQPKFDTDGYDYEAPEDDYAFYGGYSQQRQAQQRMRPAQTFQFPPLQMTTEASSGGHPRLHIGHRRTPSELTPLMAEQLALQQQIELLQQQQQLLQQAPLLQMQPQLANVSAMSMQGPGGGHHRRHQSQQVTSYPAGTLGGVGLQASTNLDGSRMGHNRRHSANVSGNLNAITGFQFPQQPPFIQANQQGGSGDQSQQQQRGHSRRSSRNIDGNWRNSSVGNEVPSFTQQQYQQIRNVPANGGGKMGQFAMRTGIPGMPSLAMMMPPNIAAMTSSQQLNANARKSLFAPYLPQASLPALLQGGKLVMGTLRINKRNRSDAYVATEILDADIYICGSKDRNRALEGDVVAVELLDVDEVWNSKREKEEKKRRKEEGNSLDNAGVASGNGGASSHNRSQSVSSNLGGGRKNDYKKKDDVEVEGQGLTLFEDEEVTDEQKPKYAGHIVAVMERMPGQMFAGTLGLLRPSSAATKERQQQERRDRGEAEPVLQGKPDRPKIVWFKPQDKRVPLIAIPTEQAPKDFVNNPEKYVSHLFVACIKRWPITSLHPFGTLVSSIGKMGDIEVETEALLKDNNFAADVDFTDNITKTLPPIPLTISEHEASYRRDLRGERVFTIDPATSKDLDDAIHIRRVDDGNYQVGVHIADVSFFVKPNTAVDREAKKRATSVYLVQRAIPMLPTALCEEICSLIPNEDRLAFSVIWTLNEDARVVDTWFGKTMIRSRGRLSYENAQTIIDGGSLASEDVKLSEDAISEDIERDILAFDKLAKRLRSRRFENGSLSIDSPKLIFDLDEHGTPIRTALYESHDANRLIEEFMLLANISVAQRIAQAFPEQALLRRHPEPADRRLAAFQEHSRRFGFDMDISSSGALQTSLSAVNDENNKVALQLLCVKPMKAAKYFCSGLLDIKKYHHYALNVPLYTHFTSPIRRYADVIVHRQLEAALMGDTSFSMDIEAVAKAASHCNLRKDSAKLAQEQSMHLFLCVLLHNSTLQSGPVTAMATVIRVLDTAFDVFIPRLGIEKRMHIDQIPIENQVYNERARILQIYWQKGVDTVQWLDENGDPLVAHGNLVIGHGNAQASKMVVTKAIDDKAQTGPVEVSTYSAQDESALFDDDDEEEEVVAVEEAMQEDEAGVAVAPANQEASNAMKANLESKTIPKSTEKNDGGSQEPGSFECVNLSESIQFENISSNNGHYIQLIKELSKVPVIVCVDMGNSPPVIKVAAVNPFA